MSTLRDLTNSARDHARAAQEAAQDATIAATVAVAPVREGLAETQHEVEQQGTALDETHGIATAAGQSVTALEAVVDTLLIDVLMGGA